MIERMNVPMAREAGVTVEAAEHIRSAIRSGRIAPGERIVERTIASDLGISSIAVRDAFARLAQEGWIERLPRRGVRVRRLEPEEIEDISALRALLEGEAAARAAAQLCSGAEPSPLSASTLALITSIPDAMHRAARRGDRQTLFALDDAFHAALWHLAESPTLEELLQNLRARITPIIRQALWMMPKDDMLKMGAWHAELLAAIHEGPKPARRAAEHHTDRTRRQVLDAN
jgi:DNA-binding GntR family transcriptional regulator